MSNDKKNNAAANQAAVLKENTDTVTTEVNNHEGSTVENTDTVTTEVINPEGSTVESDDTVTTEVINPEGSTVESTDKSATKELEIIFLLSPTGAYGLAYNVGEKGFFPELQAKELVESAYAEFV